ncbi:MAG TPA: translation initiation factor IF-6 [archaeon]|jgi:translation initiation factor 6|nr:translation initiation factor IF-6 [archaeon]
MKLDRSTIYNSPFLNIYSYCTEKICLVPHSVLPKEERKIEEILDVKVIKASINRSGLLGIYLSGINEKIVVEKNSIHSDEIEHLEKEGLKVKTIKDENNAFGNLLAVNSNYGIASPLLLPETISELRKFLKVEIEQKNFAGLDLPGSSIFVSDSLFLINPRIDIKEFNYFKKKFNVPGKAITANYGDVFVGNDITGNKNGILVGETTSNIEMTRIDELVVDLK